MPIEEISLRPELSSPPRFRNQGGSTSVTEKDEVRTKEILVSNIGFIETKQRRLLAGAGVCAEGVQLLLHSHLHRGGRHEGDRPP